MAKRKRWCVVAILLVCLTTVVLLAANHLSADSLRPAKDKRDHDSQAAISMASQIASRNRLLYTGCNPEKQATSLEEAAERQLQYQKLARQSWPGNGAVIFTCTPGNGCSGLGDRIKGLLTTYWLAVFTCRAFFIDWRRPSPLEKFWQPVALNWSIPNEEQRSNLEDQTEHFSRHIDISCSRMMDLALSSSVARFSNTHDRFSECLKPYLKLYDIHSEFPWEPWVTSLQRLFQASKEMESAFQKFKSDHDWNPERSVCIQVRSGGSIGPTVQGARAIIEPTRSYRENPSLPFKCATELSHRRILPEKNVGNHYLVFADHDSTVDDAGRYLQADAKISDTRSLGPLVHIDKNFRSMIKPQSIAKTRQSQGFENIDPSIRLLFPRKKRRKKSKVSQVAAINAERDRRRFLQGERRVFLDHYLLSQCVYVIASHSSFCYSAVLFSGNRTKKEVIQPKYSDLKSKQCHVVHFWLKL